MNAKKIKEELTKIFPGFIVAALVAWFDNSSSRWLYALLAFLALYVILTICQNWDRICYLIKLKVYTILRKSLLKSIPGFCGREDVINEVYTQYWSAKGVRVVLICGLGGSGKTTVYKFFNNANQELNKSLVRAAAMRPKIWQSRPDKERTMEAVWMSVN